MPKLLVAFLVVQFLCITILMRRAVAQSGPPTVAAVELFDADTDRAVGPLTAGLAVDGTKPRTVVVTVGGSAKSVKFVLGTSVVVENTAPYAIGGDVAPDKAGDLKAFAFPPGANTLVVTAWSGASATGTSSAATTIPFTVTGAPPPPSTTQSVVGKMDIVILIRDPGVGAGSDNTQVKGKLYAVVQITNPVNATYSDLVNASLVNIKSATGPTSGWDYAVTRDPLTTQPATQPADEKLLALIAALKASGGGGKPDVSAQLDAIIAAATDATAVQSAKLLEFVDYIGQMQTFQKEAGQRATTRPAELAGLNAAADNTLIVVGNAKTRAAQLKAILDAIKAKAAEAKAAQQ
jgi:hypothetical protein